MPRNKGFAQIIIVLVLTIRLYYCQSNGAPVIFPDDSGQPNENPVPKDRTGIIEPKCKPKDCHAANFCFLHVVDETQIGQCVRPDGSNGVCCAPDVKIIGKDFEG